MFCRLFSYVFDRYYCMLYTTYNITNRLIKIIVNRKAYIKWRIMSSWICVFLISFSFVEWWDIEINGRIKIQWNKFDVVKWNLFKDTDNSNIWIFFEIFSQKCFYLICNTIWKNPVVIFKSNHKNTAYLLIAYCKM